MIITKGYGIILGGSTLAVPLEVELFCPEFDIELTTSYEIELNTVQYTVEITDEGYDLEVCNG